MNQKVVARGNATRQLNKAMRREKILDLARELIATQGFDAFTLSELAARAEVSVPTIHNLFGKKQDIFEELCTEMVVRIEEVVSRPDVSDPVESAEAFIDNLLALYRTDEAFYRAAFVAGERTGLFEHALPSGIFNKALRIAQKLCVAAKEEGFLQGNIDSSWLAEQLFGCQRLARQDWVAGYIDLERYRTQVLIGMYVTYAADATPGFHQRLLERIDGLVKRSGGRPSRVRA
jgi:AcrR family transcriptional regulator